MGIVDDLAALAVPLADLEELADSPRRGDVDAVARSYEAFGQRKPIVARRMKGERGVVIAGNHQLAAARKLGWSQIAVVWVDDDDETAHAFALADNRTGETLQPADEIALPVAGMALLSISAGPFADHELGPEELLATTTGSCGRDTQRAARSHTGAQLLPGRAAALDELRLVERCRDRSAPWIMTAS